MLSFKNYINKVKKKYVSLHFDNRSEELLRKYAVENGFDITKSFSGKDIDEKDFHFHTTVFFTSNRMMFENGEYKLDSPIMLGFSDIELLGKEKNIPVLRIKMNRELDAVRKNFEEMGFRDEWPSYKPHVSLSYNRNDEHNIHKIKLPTFRVAATKIVIEDQE